MRFAAVHRAYLQSSPALGASCTALGAWIRLLVLASDRESERIPAPKSDREALTVAGVTLDEIKGAIDAGLVVRDGEHH